MPAIWLYCLCAQMSASISWGCAKFVIGVHIPKSIKPFCIAPSNSGCLWWCGDSGCTTALSATSADWHQHRHWSARTHTLPGSARTIIAFFLLLFDVCVSDQEPHTFTVLISLHLKWKYNLKPGSLARITHFIVIQTKLVHVCSPQSS